MNLRRRGRARFRTGLTARSSIGTSTISPVKPAASAASTSGSFHPREGPWEMASMIPARPSASTAAPGMSIPVDLPHPLTELYPHSSTPRQFWSSAPGSSGTQHPAVLDFTARWFWITRSLAW
jgi:hypothetical protein